MSQKKIKKIVHFALQGGGAHGAFTWGVLDKIIEDGRLTIDGIAATSAGSMNALMYAYGYMEGGGDGARQALHDFWYNISQSTPFGKVNMPQHVETALNRYNFIVSSAISNIFSPYQLNPGNYNIIRDILQKMVDFDKLKHTKHNNLFISATNVRSGSVRVFTNEELSIEVFLASSCLPYLFQAVEIDGEHYWDGGYMGNPPIFPLFYHGKTRDVIVVHINPITRNDLPTKAYEIMNRINEITFNSSLIKEFRAIAFVQKLLNDGWIKDEFKNKLHNILVHSIRADKALHEYEISSKYDTNWGFLKHLRDLGRKEAEKWLADNFDNLGHKSAVNLHQDFLG